MSGDPSPDEPSLDDPWAHLRRFTDARIALGRAGDALPTRRVLEFQLAHARARDAVHRPLDLDRLSRDLQPLAPVTVRSRAGNRAEYLQRPDLGRRLADDAALPPGPCEIALVVGDGLSALAVEENAPPLVQALRVLRPAWGWSAPFVALQARVAFGDEVAERIGAPLVVMLIGERPGLSAADSLGAYVTWDPRSGVTRDAQRNCVSNIRAGGLAVEDAARRIVALCEGARRWKLTGVGLKEDAALELERRLALTRSDPPPPEGEGGGT